MVSRVRYPDAQVFRARSARQRCGYGPPDMHHKSPPRRAHTRKPVAPPEWRFPVMREASQNALRVSQALGVRSAKGMLETSFMENPA